MTRTETFCDLLDVSDVEHFTLDPKGGDAQQQRQAQQSSYEGQPAAHRPRGLWQVYDKSFTSLRRSFEDI